MLPINYRQPWSLVISGARFYLKRPSFTIRRIYRHSRSLNAYINTNPPDIKTYGSGDDGDYYRSD